jgi:hypothetical protein
MGINWGSLIGGGIAAYAGYKGQEKAADAATQASDRAIQAAAPKSVYGTMGQAKYDPISEAYKFGLSPQMAGLFSQQMGDIGQFRNQRQALSGDPEAEALRRARITQAAMEPGRESRYEKTLSGLYGKGLGTSSLGSQMFADLDTQERIRDAQILEQSRTGVQGDITNLLNREAAARQASTALGAIPESLANIGINVGSNLGTAAIAGIKPLTNVGQDQAKMLSGLGTTIGSGIGDWINK